MRNKRVIAEILSSAGAGSLEQTSDADKENVKTLRDFYEACVDEDRVDRQGDEPLLEPVRHVIDLWRGAASTSEFQRLFAPLKASKPLTDALVYLHSRGVPALFEITAQGDLKNDPEDMMAWVSQSGLGLPSLDYYDEKAVVDVYTEVVRSSLKSIYGALEGEGLAPGKPYSTLAHDIVAFEKQIAKVSLDVVDIEDPIGTYNPLKLGALQKLLPQVSFSDYFAGQGSYMPDRVIVTSPSYLGNLSAIVADTDATVLEGYFVFRLAQELGPLLGPKTTTHKEIAWMENYLGGVDEGVRKSRADMCLEAVEENLGFLIGRYYVQRAFAGDSREYAEDIIGATIDAFKARLPELDWLDQETRDAAEVKASAILRHIGFPDQTPDTTNAEALRRYYKPNMPITSTDFFGNVLRTRTADVKRMWAQLGKPRDHGLWEMVPSEVNAYMNPPTNDLFFPAGIMQEPYFSKDWCVPSVTARCETMLSISGTGLSTKRLAHSVRLQATSSRTHSTLQVACTTSMASSWTGGPRRRPTVSRTAKHASWTSTPTTRSPMPRATSTTSTASLRSARTWPMLVVLRRRSGRGETGSKATATATTLTTTSCPGSTIRGSRYSSLRTRRAGRETSSLPRPSVGSGRTLTRPPCTASLGRCPTTSTSARRSSAL